MATNRIRTRRPAPPRTPAAIRTDSEQVERFLVDAAHMSGGHAPGVASPDSLEQLAELVHRGAPVLAIGAQSSLTGGATPRGELVIDTSRLASIDVSGRDRVTAGPGVTLEVLQDALQLLGSFYPPVPTFAGACAGGVVATNAAGPATFKYGVTRDWVIGLTLVLASGDILEIERGQVAADDVGVFEIAETTRTYRVSIPTYRMPSVPKCSAGYYAAPGMDLVDLFIGSEGTLGIVASVTFRTIPAVPASCIFFVTATSEAQGLDLVRDLRHASLETRAAHDPTGIDVTAIEHMDRRCLDLLVEDGADRRHDVVIPDDAAVALVIQLDLPNDLPGEEVYAQVGRALDPTSAMTPLIRMCRIVAAHGLLDRMEMALPAERARCERLFALREAVPTGVNQRIARVKAVDSRIEKVAADMIVPFPAMAPMMAAYRDTFARHGLDGAVWGHISDGNVHPNVIPRSYEDVETGKAAIRDLGRLVTSLGGSPLAEHGVGRNVVKQALLRDLYGDEGIRQMQQVKAALDPQGRLAPGVIFPAG